MLIDALLRDFMTPSIGLSASALPLYIELILNLTTLSPYELLMIQAELDESTLDLVNPSSLPRNRF